MTIVLHTTPERQGQGRIYLRAGRSLAVASRQSSNGMSKLEHCIRSGKRGMLSLAWTLSRLLLPTTDAYPCPIRLASVSASAYNAEL